MRLGCGNTSHFVKDFPVCVAQMGKYIENRKGSKRATLAVGMIEIRENGKNKGKGKN